MIVGSIVLFAACAAQGAQPGAEPAPTLPFPARAVASGSAPTVAALRATIDSLINLPEFRSAHWGVLIVDPGRGETLYSHNAGKLFMPASNQKLLTGSVALALLGPDYRFRTAFIAGGPVRAGVLQGDLGVLGRGDPSISDALRNGDALSPLRAVADTLHALGVREIRGTVRVVGNAFADTSLGYGWAWDDLDYAYSAGVDELLLNEGFTNVRVLAGTGASALVTASTAPVRGYPTVDVRLVRVDSSLRPGRSAVSLATLTSGAIVATGSIAPGDSVVERVAYRDVNGAYLAGLRQVLGERGITVRGAAMGDTARGGLTGDTIAIVLSPPLRDILPRFEKPSQNQIGEVLLKTLGLERTGVGSADSGRAVIERQLVAWGALADGVVVRDGSGLSRHDYVTPESIIRVLDAMRRSESYQIFYDALPVAGVDGTIANRMKGTVAQGNVHAKTGYIDKARSLSGYVTTADGRLLLFSLLCNNFTTPVRAVERVQDTISVRLAGLGAR